MKNSFYDIDVFLNKEKFSNLDLDGGKDKITLDVDFCQKCNFKKSMWSNCKIQNAGFNNLNFGGAEFVSNTFKNFYFTNCDFRNTTIVSSKCVLSIFENVLFDNVDFRNAIILNPYFKNCNFKNCNFKNVDFNGSGFDYCKFEGVLDSPIFRGKANSLKRTSLLDKLLMVKSNENKMINIDFTKSQLKGVTFIDEIDLSTCKFPENDLYILVKNHVSVFNEMKKVLENLRWSFENKKTAIQIIDIIYLRKESIKNSHILVDAFLLDEFGENFRIEFFSLLKKILKTRL